MSRFNKFIGKIGCVCISAVTLFATQIANSACIWWMHQPKEPDSLKR